MRLGPECGIIGEMQVKTFEVFLCWYDSSSAISCSNRLCHIVLESFDPPSCWHAILSREGPAKGEHGLI